MSYLMIRKNNETDFKRAKKNLPDVSKRVKAIKSCACDLFSPEEGFMILKQPGDGSCFFASLANGLMGEKYNATKNKNSVAHEYRDEIADMANEAVYTKQKKRILKKAQEHHERGKAPPPPNIPSYDQFIKNLRTKSKWADLVMIAYFALKFHVNLYFWDEKACKFYYGTDRNNASKKSSRMKTIFINWTNNRSHFELIVKENPNTGRIQHYFTRGKDGAFLKRVEQYYESQ